MQVCKTSIERMDRIGKIGVCDDKKNNTSNIGIRFGIHGKMAA